MELATSADISTPDADHSKSNIHPIVSEVRNEPMDSRTTPPNIHCDTLNNREDTDDRYSAVSNTRTLNAANWPLITA